MPLWALLGIDGFESLVSPWFLKIDRMPPRGAVWSGGVTWAEGRQALPVARDAWRAGSRDREQGVLRGFVTWCSAEA